MPQPKSYDSAAQKQAAYRERMAAARATQLASKGLPSLPVPSTIPGTARWRGLLAHACWALQTMESEMQDYQGNRSESWQESERSEEFETRFQAVAEISADLKELEIEHFQK